MVRNSVLVVNLEQSQKQLIYQRVYSQTERDKAKQGKLAVS